MLQPESLVPDIKKELTELVDAQDVKVETQKSRFVELERAKLKLAEEADDVLRIVFENSPDPEKFILEAIGEYARDEGISLLAAKAKVLQYLSPSFKEKVDAEVREYFEKLDLSKFVRLPDGSEEVETLKILCDEGYMPYFVIAVHYQDDPGAKRQTLTNFEMFREAIKDKLKNVERKSFDEKESFVLNPENIFPEAKKYMEELKKTKTKEEYEYVISLVYKNLNLGRATNRVFPELDCDERTLFLQKIAIDESLEVGGYMEISGHVAVKLDGLPLVLDTYDFKIRTIEECAKNEGYGEGYDGSYFWRDNKEEYLAKYEDSGNYPKEIVGYERAKYPYLVNQYSDISALLHERAWVLRSEGKTAEAKLYFEQILNINPDYALAHEGLAALLEPGGKTAEAKFHYERALEIDPNNRLAHEGLAALLKSEGENAEYKFRILEIGSDNTGTNQNLAILLESKGKTAEAKFHYERALEIDPNSKWAHEGFAGLLESEGKTSEAKLHYEQILEIDPKNTYVRYKFARLLESEGKIAEAKFHYERILEIAPNSAWGHYNLAALLESKGEIAEAKSHYERALEIDPNDKQAHEGFAVLLYGQNEFEEARRHLDEFNRLRDDWEEADYKSLDAKLKEKGC